MLVGEVPLLRHCRLEILICEANALTRVAADVDSCAISQQSAGARKPSSKRTAIVVHSDNTERWVHCELFVSALALRKSGDSISAPNHSLAPERGWRPGKSDTRFPIATTKIIVVKTGIAKLRRTIP